MSLINEISGRRLFAIQHQSTILKTLMAGNMNSNERAKETADSTKVDVAAKNDLKSVVPEESAKVDNRMVSVGEVSCMECGSG